MLPDIADILAEFDAMQADGVKLAAGTVEQDEVAYITGDISLGEMERGIRVVAQMEPVALISGEEFAKGEVDLVSQVAQYFDALGGKVRSAQLGDVVLDRRGVKADISHGIGRKKPLLSQRCRTSLPTEKSSITRRIGKTEVMTLRWWAQKSPSAMSRITVRLS